MQMWLTGEYREVVQNQRLVDTESLSDENGNVISPEELGMPAGYPTTTEVRVELQDVGGRTKMVMTPAGVQSDSGCHRLVQAFDKLAAHVQVHLDR